ncbi:MAG: Ig-like domain-containing protein [Lachnospiraceae bacterium]|nr:Ig-like domain-containing protein [Lachnospiraceae bacterium]
MSGLAKTFKKAMAVTLAVALSLTGTNGVNVSAKKKIKLNKKKLTLYVGKKAKLVLKNVNKKQKKKIKWSTNKTKIIKVSKAGYVKGLKKGRAYAIAKLGKKKYKCLVTVKAKKTTVSASPAQSAAVPTVDVTVTPATQTNTPAASESAGVSESPQDSETPTDSDSPSDEPSATASSKVSESPSATPAQTESAKPTATASSKTSESPSATPAETKSAEPTATASESQSATPAQTESAKPTATASESPSATPAETKSAEPTSTASETVSPDVTESPEASEGPVLSGSITYDTGFWTTLLEKLTFGVYEADATVNITSTGDDCKIYYYVYNGSAALTAEDLDKYTFKEYTGEFKLSNGDSVVYAKLVSTEDTSVYKYISSDGITIEKEEAVVTAVSITPANSSIKVGMSVKLTAQITAEGDYTKGVDWTSKDTSVATVDSEGNVLGRKAGTTTITAKANNGVKGEATITVTDIYPTSITISKEEITLSPGGTDSLAATILPENASVKTVTWSSNNESVATINSGTVTAVNAGTAVISASVQGENGTTLTKNCYVTVLEESISANSITITNKTDTGIVGSTLQLETTTSPEVITNPITWSSLDTSVATVNDAGLVTFVAEGEVTIVATVDGKKDTVTITVEKGKVYPTSIVLNQDKASVNVGQSVSLQASLLPSTITETDITWTSSDESVATVAAGLVTAIGKGSATITAKAKSSEDTYIEATFTIEVNVPVESIEITNVSDNTISLYVDEDDDKATYQLITKVSPEDADQTVQYKSSNTDILSVSSTGYVRAYSPGTAKITASAEDKSTVVTVNIYKRAKSITLSDITVIEGNRKAIPVTLNPSDTTDSISDIKWNSESTGVAVVAKNDSGEAIVTGICEGSTTITATINGSVTATCTVTVAAKEETNHITEATLTGATLNVNATKQLSWTEEKEDNSADTTDTVTFKVADESIATINSTGLVTGVSEGTTTATLLVNGTAFSTATITVNNPVVSVTAPDERVTIYIGKKVDLKNYVTATLADGTSIPITVANMEKYGLSFVCYKQTAISLDSSTGVCEGTAKGTNTITFDTGTVYDTFYVDVKAIDATSVTISGDDLVNKAVTLDRDNTSKKTTTISAKTDADATYQGITYSSANEAVATIDSNGNITAVGIGTTTIRATSEDEKAYDEITVTVTARTLALDLSWTNGNETKSSASHSDGTVIETTTCSDSVNTGATGTIYVTKYHEDSVDVINDDFENTDSTVVLVNKVSDGVYTYNALKAGTATITFTTSNNITATITFTVSDIPISYINVTGDGLSNNAVTYDIVNGTSYKLNAEVNSDATDKTLTWSVESGKESVLKVDSEGNIKVLSPGTAVVTVAGGSISVDITVTVRSQATAITLPETLTVNTTEWTDLNAAITPSNATYESIEWSTDSSIATLNSTTGLTNKVKGVKGDSSCTVKITVNLHDGTSISDECTVTVETTVVAVTAVTVDGSALPESIYPGDIVSGLAATVTPSNATNKTVHWTVSDDTYADIDSSTGMLTAKKAGTVTVYATAGGVTSSGYNVTITPVPASSITLSVDKDDIYPGDTFTVSREISPTTSESDVSWTVEDSDGVLSTYSENTDNNLVCKAQAAGDVYITATALDTGKVSKYIKVTVSPIAVEQITMEESEVSIKEGSTKQLTVSEILPENASDKSLYYSIDSSKSVAVYEGEEVASVDSETGLITAISPGTAVVTVSSLSNPSVYAEVQVTVTEVKVTGISLDKTEVTVKSGESVDFTAVVSPTNARNQKVLWKVESTGVSCNLTDLGKTGTGRYGITLEAGTVTETQTATLKAYVDGVDVVATATVTVEPIVVESITLDKKTATIVKGGTNSSATITATVSPSNAVNDDLTWVVKSGSSYVNLTQDGNNVTVTGRSAGEAVIYAKTTDGTVRSSECTITVSVASTGMTLLDSSKEEVSILNLDPGDSETITASFSPSGSLGYVKSWTSSNTDVCTVSNGKITGVKYGTTTVTVTADNGDGTELTESLTVYVNKISVSSVSITGDTISDKTLTITEGDSVDLEGVVAPSNADEQGVTWSFASSSYASLSSYTTASTTLTATAEGTTTLTLTSNENSNLYDTITVVVEEDTKLVDSISITGGPTGGNIYAGNTFTLTANVSPSDASNKNIQWTSSDSSIASVANTTSQTVTVSANAAGTVTITAKALGGSSSCEDASVTINVLGNIKLSSEDVTLKEGATKQLSATVIGLDKSELVWSVSSSNPTVSGNTVVTVDDTGFITAVSAGEATVSATIGDVTAVCEVTVTSAATSITISDTELTLEVGESYLLTATSDSSTASIAWGLESKYSSYIRKSVTTKGCTVTGLKVGTAVITAKISDNTDITASCTITVVESTAASESPSASPSPTPVSGKMTLTASSAGNVKTITTFEREGDITFPASDYYTELGMTLSDKITVSSNYSNGKAYYHYCKFEDLPYYYSSGSTTTYQYSIDEDSKSSANVWPQSDIYTTIDEIKEGTDPTKRFVEVPEDGFSFPSVTDSSSGYMVYIKIVDDQGFDSTNCKYLANGYPIYVYADGEAPTPAPSTDPEVPSPAPSDEGDSVESVTQTSGEDTLAVGNMYATMGERISEVRSHNGTEVRSYYTAYGVMVYVFNPGTDYKNLLYVYYSGGEVVGMATVSPYAKYYYQDELVVETGQSIPSGFTNNSDYGLESQYYCDVASTDDYYQPVVEAYTDKNGDNKVYAIRVFDTGSVSMAKMNEIGKCTSSIKRFTNYFDTTESNGATICENTGYTNEISELVNAYRLYCGLDAASVYLEGDEYAAAAAGVLAENSSNVNSSDVANYTSKISSLKTGQISGSIKYMISPDDAFDPFTTLVSWVDITNMRPSLVGDYNYISTGFGVNMDHLNDGSAHSNKTFSTIALWNATSGDL